MTELEELEELKEKYKKLQEKNKEITKWYNILHEKHYKICKILKEEQS
tara:strand:+ start:1791 stop:1934 length:144 start_codon:yes stop_codon:yes gene_type:complete